MRRSLAFAFLLALLLAPAPALAHSTGTSFVEILSGSGSTEVELSLTFHTDELGAVVALDADGDRLLGPEDVTARLPQLAAATLDRVGISVPAGTCVRGQPRGALDPSGGLSLSATFGCPGAAGQLDLALGYVDVFPPGHKILGRARLGGEEREFVADAASPSVKLKGPARSFLSFVALGVEHIFGGLDHLLFLAGLLLVVRSFREALAVISSFTVAHSITLGLATAGLVTLPGRIVEPLIAASVIYVGAENLLSPKPRGRVYLTFGFGLVHGFGFAGLLRELGLAQGSFLATLAGFNLGVEAGQLCVVLAAAPLLWLARKSPRYEQALLPAGSAAIGFFGAYWLVQRLVG